MANNVLLAVASSLASDGRGQELVVPLSVIDTTVQLAMSSAVHIAERIGCVARCIRGLGCHCKSGGVEKAGEVFGDERLNSRKTSDNEGNINFGSRPDGRQSTDPGVVSAGLSLDNQENTDSRDDGDPNNS